MSEQPHDRRNRDPQDKKSRDHKRHRFCINDHVDILVEVLRRLDGPSLCTAACVCRLWCAVARTDSIWEDLCFRHVSPPPSASVRPVISALGGYRRLYMVSVRRVLKRVGFHSGIAASRQAVLWTRDQVQLSLSLFCVDYYERLCAGSRLGDAPSTSASSVMFLCKPVNVV